MKKTKTSKRFAAFLLAVIMCLSLFPLSAFAENDTAPKTEALEAQNESAKTEEPKAEEPKAEEPKAEEPKAEEPKAEEPKAEEPKAEEPKAEEPKAEEPKAEEPKAEEPKAEEPKTEQPKAEEPKAEEPKAEEPKAEEPKAEEPKAEEPKAEEPKTEEPKTEEPNEEEPKAEEPKTEEPKAEEPKTEEPKTEEPNAEEPKTEEPKTEEPKAEEPKQEEQTDPAPAEPAQNEAPTEPAVTGETDPEEKEEQSKEPVSDNKEEEIKPAEEEKKSEEQAENNEAGKAEEKQEEKSSETEEDKDENKKDSETGTEEKKEEAKPEEKKEDESKNKDEKGETKEENDEQKQSVQVAFYANDALWATVSVEEGSAIGAGNMPANPSKVNSTFVKWVDSGGNTFAADTVVNADMTVIAVFEENAAADSDNETATDPDKTDVPAENDADKTDSAADSDTDKTDDEAKDATEAKKKAVKKATTKAGETKAGDTKASETYTVNYSVRIVDENNTVNNAAGSGTSEMYSWETNSWTVVSNSFTIQVPVENYFRYRVTPTRNKGYVFYGYGTDQPYPFDDVPEYFTKKKAGEVADITVTLKFVPSTYRIEITFEADGSGTVSQESFSGTYDYYDQNPVSITCTATPNAGNVFMGWYKGDTLVTKNPVLTDNVSPEFLWDIVKTTYTAKFAQEYSTITWKNDDGDVLETDKNVAAGETPSYNGDTPTKEPTHDKIFTFAGWNPDIKPVVGDQIYTATYTEATREYTVNFVSDGETILSFTRKYEEAIGNMPEDPFVQGKVFKRWTALIDGQTVEVAADTAVKSDLTVTAEFQTIDLYCLTVNCFYTVNGQKRVFNTDIYNYTGDELPTAVTVLASTQVDQSLIPTQPTYYPTSTTVAVTADDNWVKNNEGIYELTKEIEYIEYTAEYDFSYQLKDLTGSGYTEIESQHVKGVLGSTVTASVKSYPYAEFERTETTVIDQASGIVIPVYYTRRSFHINYHTGGSYIAPSEGLYGASVTVTSTVPEKQGYTFKGWYLDEEYETQAPAAITLEKDTDLFAKWEGKEVSLTVTYYKQKYGQTDYVYDNSRRITASVGSTVTATDSTVPKLTNNILGYEFDDALNANSSVVVAADGSSVLKVYYSLITYTLTFNARPNNNYNRATVEGHGTYSFTAVLGQDISSLWPKSVVSNRWGYRFNVWRLAGFDYGLKTTQVSIEEFIPHASGTTISFTAEYTQASNTGHVDYYLQGADGNYVKDNGLSQDFIVTGNLTPKTLDGYTINESKTVQADQINIGSWLNPVYVYTRYEFYYDRAQYQIDYFDGAANIGTKTGILFGADISGSTYNWKPTKQGATFAYWCSDAGLNSRYSFSVMPASNLALYAKWTYGSYTVSFDTAGGTPAVPTQTIEQNAGNTKTAEEPNVTLAKAGYTFTGWYTKEGILFDFARPITEDIELAAHWQQETLSYTVHYYKTGTTEPVLEDKVITNPALVIGQEITENAVSVAGFRPDAVSKKITLSQSGNVIVFYYSEKSGETSYKVRYLALEGNHVSLAPDKVVTGVSANTVRVIETPISIKDYHPTKDYEELVLSSDVNQNVITFYYAPYKTTIFTVHYLDMTDEMIKADTVSEPLKVGDIFHVETEVTGWVLDTSIDPDIEVTGEQSSVEITLYYKKILTITAKNKSKPYDGTDLVSFGTEDAIVTGFKSGSDHTLSSITYTGYQKNAGTCETTPTDAEISGTAAENYYSFNYVPGTLTVMAVEVTINVEPDRWNDGDPYDGNPRTIGFKDLQTGVTFNNSIYEDLYGESIRASLKDISLTEVDAGSYTIPASEIRTAITLPDDANFVVTLNIRDGELTIPKATAKITVNAAEKYYGDKDPDFSGSATGLVNQEDLGEITYIRLNDEEDVGIYEDVLTASYSENSNYNVEVTNGSFEIKTKTITVYDEATENYDGTEKTLTILSTHEKFSVEGLAEGETLSVTGGSTISGTDAGSYTTVTGTPVWTVAKANGAGDSTGNYSISVTGKLTIKPKSVSVSVKDAEDVVYDGEEHSGETEYTFEGLLEGHTATITYTPASGTGADDYTGSFEDDSFKVMNGETDVTANYSLDDKTAGKLTVTQRPIEIVVPDRTVEYNSNEQFGETEWDFNNLVLEHRAYKESAYYNPSSGTEPNTYDNGSFSENFEPFYAWSVEDPAGNDVTDNYRVDKLTPGKLIITPIKVKARIDSYQVEKPYNGEVQTETMAWNWFGDPNLLQYAGFNGPTEVSGKDVGAYDLGLKPEHFYSKDPYHELEITIGTDGRLTINPAEITVTVTGNTETKNYNGEEQKVEGYELSCDSPLFDKTRVKFSGEAVAKGTEVDIYPMNLNPENFSYDDRNISVTWDVTDGALEIKKAKITVTVLGHTDSFPYNGEEQKVEGYELSCDSELFDAGLVSYDGEAVAKGTEVDIYPMNLNPEKFSYNDPNVEVEWDVTDGALEIEKARMTVTVLGHTARLPYNGEEQKVEGYDLSSDSAFFDAGLVSYDGEAVVKGTEVDMYPMNLNPEKFSYNDPNVDVEWDVTDGALEIVNEGNAAYRVEHYQQNLDDDNYTLVSKDTQTLSASVGSMVTATPMSYTGFYLDETVPTTKKSGIVVSNGSLVLKLYYTRETFSISFDPNGGVYLGYKETFKQSYRYGKSFTFGAATRDGWAFDYWKGSEYHEGESYTVTEDHTFTAQWKQFTVTAVDYSAKYDGKSHSGGGTASVTEGTTYQYSTDGGKTWSDTAPSITNAGTVKYTIKAVNEVCGEATAEGTLTVAKRSVTLTSGSSNKVYDGTALTNGTVTVSGDGFVKGEGASYSVSGSRIQVGNSDNTFSYTLNEGTRAENYTINLVYGTLTITAQDQPVPVPVPNPGVIIDDYDIPLGLGTVTVTSGESYQ